MAGSARTAYDEKDEPLLDDVSEEGSEGVLIGRFVTSQRACRFAARRSASLLQGVLIVVAAAIVVVVVAAVAIMMYYEYVSTCSLYPHTSRR
jgi:hypothetical protein